MIFFAGKKIMVVLSLVAIVFFQQAFAQEASDWGLSKLGYTGYQYESDAHILVAKAKYTSRNFPSAVFTRVRYFPNPHLSINQLAPFDYLNWQGTNFIQILRDTVEDLGGYSTLIHVKGSDSNYAKDFETDKDDNYIILGDNKGNGWNPQNPVNSSNKDSTQILICKVKEDNTVLWYKIYGGSSAEYAIAIKKAPDGNFIVLAQTQSDDGDITNYNGGKDIWILKINNIDGSIIWKKTIGTIADEIPTDLEILADGSIIISGAAEPSRLFPSTHTGLNSFLLKLHADASIEWSKVFGGNGNDRINAFVPYFDGGYVSISTTNSSDGDYPDNNGGSDVYVLRHNKTGDIVWKKHYGFADDDIAGDIAFNKCDSNIYITFSKKYNGAIQPFNIYPDYSQTAGLRATLKSDGTELYYYQDSFVYPYYNYNNEYFNVFLTPSIAANNRGGILSAYIGHARINEIPGLDNGHVVRSFGMVDYGIPLNKINFDTTICKGHLAWGQQFTRDTTYSDTLRNNCQIDTLISKYHIHLVNADSSIYKDTIVCYGKNYKGVPVYASFLTTDTTSITTTCEPKLIITNNNIKVSAQIINNLGADTILCKNTSILLSAYKPASAYLWQNNTILSTYTAATAGLVWVQVTDTLGCKARDSVTIGVTDLYLNILSDTTITSIMPVMLYPLSNGKVNWSYDATLKCSFCQNNIANPAATTTYFLTASKDNCTINTSIKIIVNKEFYMYIPNSFTPNNDNLNDIFKVFTNYTGLFTLEIYNRYGERIFETNNLLFGWDGNLKGVRQPEGTYTYLIKFQKPGSVKEIKKGHLVLLK